MPAAATDPAQCRTWESPAILDPLLAQMILRIKRNTCRVFILALMILVSFFLARRFRNGALYVVKGAPAFAGREDTGFCHYCRELHWLEAAT